MTAWKGPEAPLYPMMAGLKTSSYWCDRVLNFVREYVIRVQMNGIGMKCQSVC